LYLALATLPPLESMALSFLREDANAFATRESLTDFLRAPSLRSVCFSESFSFLRTKKALKSLVVHVHQGVTESCLSAFHIDIAAVLQDSASLESISIISSNPIRPDGYVAFFTSLQHHQTLKSLNLQGGARCLRLTDDEVKQMAALVKKDYVLESLPGIDLEKEAGDIGAILRLNAAGRRYLIVNRSSVSKGVEVFSRVNNDITCVFLHLLENPNLCDISAAEVASDSTERKVGDRRINPANRNGKREQGRALEEGKESRRRRT
jgi:hypothetical protein